MSLPKGMVLAFALPIATAALSESARGQTQPFALANPITNPDATGTSAIPPFNAPLGVVNRPRPDYDSAGVQLGNFQLRPSIAASGIHIGNVFNSNVRKQSDWAAEIAPTLNLISNLPRHALSALLSVRQLFYSNVTSENRTNVTAALRGRFDVDRATNITVDGGYQTLHEIRGAPDLPGNAAKPTEFAIASTQVGLNHTFNRLQVSAGASYMRLDYSNTLLVPPGPAFRDNSDRNRDVVTVYAQAGYEFSPGYLGFVRGSYNTRNYDLKSDSSNFARDSDGVEINGGVQFEVTRLLVGQVYAGYLQQTYADARFAPVSGPSFGGALQWYPTEMTTVRFNARRSVEETTIFGASSYTTAHFGIGVDHELLRNVILSADAVFDENHYNGTPRTDRFWGISMGAAYLLNRNMQLNASYVFAHRDSNITGLGFSNNILRFGLVGNL